MISNFLELLMASRRKDLIPALQDNRDGRLNVVRFSVPAPEILRKFLPIYLIWRILSLFLCLLHALLISVPKGFVEKRRVDGVLVQNPPAMPLLAVVYLYCNIMVAVNGYRPAFIIDWHNLGFTSKYLFEDTKRRQSILQIGIGSGPLGEINALKKFLSSLYRLDHYTVLLGKSPIVVNIAKLYEKIMAPLATSHMCVTDGMKAFIEKEFGVDPSIVHVLHDCPGTMFYPRSAKDNHELMTKLHGKLCAGCPRSWYQHLDPSHQTLFTENLSNNASNDEGNYVSRQNRPALVTSSTSWTTDEDFGVLLNALVQLDNKISELQSSLKVVVAVTGKGPQKGFYQKEIAMINFQNIVILTLWLEPADYPRLLACADIGVSLHTSTSGIDLPMKILDNFGCEVPVCAFDFPCLKELVEDDVNGRTFETVDDLTEQLLALLSPLDKSPESWAPHSFGDLARYSRKLKGRTGWEENWSENALPAIQAAVPK